MKTTPITQAVRAPDVAGEAVEVGEVAKIGAIGNRDGAGGGAHHLPHATIAQARQVHLAGNGLPGRWAGRQRFVVVGTGFGCGLDFLVTWMAWRADAARCERLVFIAIEPHPPAPADLERAHARAAPSAIDAAEFALLAARLRDVWPPPTPNLHPIDFEDSRVRLLLGFGDAGRLLPQVLASVDAFFLDGSFADDGSAPTRKPAPRLVGLLKQLGRLAAPDATATALATRGTARLLRAGLTTAGFEVDSVPGSACGLASGLEDERAAGLAPEREMCVARYLPSHVRSHVPPPLTPTTATTHTPSTNRATRTTRTTPNARTTPTARSLSPPAGGLHVPDHGAAREAIVVGAGLAGCAAAWALTREGWRVTLLDRETAPARATSGNAVGLFHGAVHAGDGPHARLLRAAALRAARVLRPWIASGRVRGQIDGLLRLDAGPSDAGSLGGAARAHADVQSQSQTWTDAHPDAHSHALSHAHAHAHAHATGHARPVDRDAARLLTGVPVPAGGWWFGEGGWLVPGDFARALLDDSGARFVGAVDVARIDRFERRWCAFDARGALLGAAPVMVLANALQMPCLLGAPLAAALGPLAAVRGQLTGVPRAAWPSGLHRPCVPLSGRGYAAPVLDDTLWCGATSQVGEQTPALRDGDHRRNLAQLVDLLGDARLADVPLDGLAGRVGWRAVTPDRLPLVGAVPDLAACSAAPRLDRVRHAPRLRDGAGGLHVLGALGSRGITWAVLCGELLASWATGAPCPVEADLRDALDPARRLVARRRAAASRSDA